MLRGKSLMAATTAYRMASYEAVQILAEEIPIDLLIKERMAIYDIRKGNETNYNNIAVQCDREQEADYEHRH